MKLLVKSLLLISWSWSLDYGTETRTPSSTYSSAHYSRVRVREGWGRGRKFSRRLDRLFGKLSCKLQTKWGIAPHSPLYDMWSYALYFIFFLAPVGYPFGAELVFFNLMKLFPYNLIALRERNDIHKCIVLLETRGFCNFWFFISFFFFWGWGTVGCIH